MKATIQAVESVTIFIGTKNNYNEVVANEMEDVLKDNIMRPG